MSLCSVANIYGTMSDLSSAHQNINVVYLSSHNPPFTNTLWLVLFLHIGVAVLYTKIVTIASRIQMAEKFVKAVAKPSRPDMNPIRY